MTIRNPVEWGVDQFRHTITGAEAVNRGIVPTEQVGRQPLPVVRQIEAADLKDVLSHGASDFGACRTDVIFLCVFYPVVGLLMVGLAAEHKMLPLVFPLASGFALLGPFAGVGLNEMSRRRELGTSVGWADAFGVLRSPSLGAILMLGLALTLIFVFWQFIAYGIYEVTLGPQLPVSIGSFIHDVFLTRAGWAMIVLGVGIGFVLAVVVLLISSVAFPLLLERDVGVEIAVQTSIRAAFANPVPMALWGMIIVAGLIIGSIPLFVGLIIVLPVLGHSTWHLYRKMVVPP
jgi:uncharacterized membrane protein